MTRLVRTVPLIVLVLALGLVLSVPAFAAPGELSVAGVITAVDGNSVSLNGGIVTLDVTNATILARGNGSTTGVAALVVGAPAMATVTGKNTDGSLVASTVLVGAAEAIELRGKLDAVDTTAGTLTLFGLTVTTDAHTVFTGATSRGPVTKLSDLQAGDTVAVEAIRSGSALVAQHVHAGDGMAPGDDDLVFAGRVETIDTASWKISGRTVAITSATQITGSPAVGDMVKVTATADTAGALTAVSIVKLGGRGDGGGQVVAIRGTLEVKNADSWTISGTVVKIDSTTVVRNDPKVGDRISGIAKKNTDGSLTGVLLIGMGAAPGGGGGHTGGDDGGHGNGHH